MHSVSCLADAVRALADTGGCYSSLCIVQVALSDHLKTLEVYHISTIPKCRLPVTQLYAAAFDTDAAETLFQELRQKLGTLVDPCLLCIRVSKPYMTLPKGVRPMGVSVT